MAKITQEQFNLRVVEILDHMKTDLERARHGSTLSNMAGIDRMISILEHDVLTTWPKSEKQDGSVIEDLPV
jgi:hypothetical protein